MITLDKLISNFERVDKNFSKIFEKEIYNLFEPIVYQIVLTTRMDTGTARASIGLPFIEATLPSSRIKEAIEKDINYTDEPYNHWRSKGYPERFAYFDYEGVCDVLLKDKKIIVDIQSFDEGFINQALNGESPSPSHPRSDPYRHIKYHTKEITYVVDKSLDIEHFSGGGLFLSEVAGDIRNRIRDLYFKIGEELFKK